METIKLKITAEIEVACTFGEEFETEFKTKEEAINYYKTEDYLIDLLEFGHLDDINISVKEIKND